MARKAPTPCRHFGCPAVVEKPGFCSKHEPEHLPKRARGSIETRTGLSKRSGSREPLYGSERWRRLSRTFRARNPLCAHCEAAGQVSPATMVDHILEIKDRPDLKWSWENLQALCTPCHQRKTMIEAGKRRRREENQ